jgi:hypothetical protein
LQESAHGREHLKGVVALEIDLAARQPVAQRRDLSRRYGGARRAL